LALQLLQTLRRRIRPKQLAVRSALVVGGQKRISVAVEVLDVLEREGEDLLPFSAVEDRDLVAPGEGRLDRLGPEESGAAEDEDPLLRGRRRARGLAVRGLVPARDAERGQGDGRTGHGERLTEEFTSGLGHVFRPSRRRTQLLEQRLSFVEPGAVRTLYETR